MTTYVDSSALVPVYVPEQFSPSARGAVRAAGQLPFTALHQLEVPNAFGLLVGRGLLTRDEGRAVHRQLRDDIEQERLLPVSLDLDQVFADAADTADVPLASLLTVRYDLTKAPSEPRRQRRPRIAASARRLPGRPRSQQAFKSRSRPQ